MRNPKSEMLKNPKYDPLQIATGHEIRNPKQILILKFLKFQTSCPVPTASQDGISLKHWSRFGGMGFVSDFPPEADQPLAEDIRIPNL